MTKPKKGDILDLEVSDYAFEGKGVSQIIVTILIILLVLVSIMIVWNVVKLTIEKSAEEIEIDVLTIDYNIAKASVYVNEDSGDLQVDVSRGSDQGELEFIKIIVKEIKL